MFIVNCHETYLNKPVMIMLIIFVSDNSRSHVSFKVLLLRLMLCHCVTHVTVCHLQ